MPTPCNYVHTELRRCQGSESGFCTGLAGWRMRFNGVAYALTGRRACLPRRPDGRNLGMTNRRPDGQGLGRYPGGDAGEAEVCPALDEVPLCVECPAGQFANGAQPHHLEQFFARDETVNVDLRLPVHLSDPDK